MSSKHAQVLAAIKAKILTLGLSGISDANVQVRRISAVDRLVKQGRITLPCIVVAPSGVENINARYRGSNKQDVYGWPSVIAIVDNADSSQLIDEIDEDDVYCNWRESLMKAFHQQHLTGVDGDMVSEVTPAPIQELTAWTAESLFVSGMNVRTYTYETVR